MIGQYKGLIPENVAPKGVTTISIYDSNDVKKASMAVPEFMKYPSGVPLYSFGILSDIHMFEDLNETHFPREDFDYALNYLKNKGAVMTCICGDLTNVGFYKNVDGTVVKSDWQFSQYKEIKDRYVDDTFKVYCIAGNHESYYKAITEDIDLYKQYTGCDLYFSIVQGNDVFIFISQPTSGLMLNTEEMEWLQAQLTTYSDKRCFVFVHPMVDSGNPLGLHDSLDIFAATPEKDNFITALKNHGNVILFHGHSHFKFECQNDDKSSNYSNKNGFHSVHVPSNAYPRIVEYVDGQSQKVEIFGGAQFYYVEVFEDCIVLNGVDIGLENGARNAKLIPQGIIKLDTAEGVTNTT